MGLGISRLIGGLCIGLVWGLVYGADQRETTTYEQELEDASQLEAIQKWCEKHERKHRKRPEADGGCHLEVRLVAALSSGLFF